MHSLKIFKQTLSLILLGFISLVHGANQTPTVDIPKIAGKDFPFKIKLELTDFELPNGLHSYAAGIHNGKWLLIAGRTNGMHGFSSTENNFPTQKQNKDVIVIDPLSGRVYSKALDHSDSGLEDWQIDLLSVTSPQCLQIGDVLYMTGGYGVDTETGKFNTKPFLTAIDLPGLIHWVEHEECYGAAAKHIRHLFHEVFQVTGGSMLQIGNNPILLIVGQNFKGFYEEGSNGEYTQQIRRFDIIDNGKKLKVKVHPPQPLDQDPNLRRRDLNIVPVLRKYKKSFKEEIDILSGVFTLTDGIWTVPVRVNAQGEPFMPNPESSKTFKQGMNNYACANFGLFSLKSGDMYTVLLGGISFGYFEEGEFKTNTSFPFINQITAIKLDQNNKYTQYLLKEKYPTILATAKNRNNPLLFGAGATFIPSDEVNAWQWGVLHIDELPLLDECNTESTRKFPIGYIVGGIASSVPNTSSRLDSKASPYIFKVTLELKN